MAENTLADHQFEVDGVVFGTGCPVEVERWHPGGWSWNTQDTRRPRQHGIRPGRDTRGSATWGFDAYVNGSEGPGALATLDELAAVWPTEELADEPGAMTALRYAVGGRTRRVYGRPREFDAPVDTPYLQGLIPITMNFVVMDPLVYDDREELVEVPLGMQTTGGLRSPLRSPMRSVYNAAPQQKAAVVGGTRPTWAIVEFEGSCLNPWLEVGTLWKAQARTALAHDDVVTIDARPQSRAATRRGGGGVPVSRATRLAEMLLPPGRHVLRFGADGGGSAVARVRWRSANHSL